MKAYKVELLIIDLDEVGEEIPGMIEGMKYPNWCLNPIVMKMESREIGEWHDNHPLNKDETMKTEYERLFNKEQNTV